MKKKSNEHQQMLFENTAKPRTVIACSFLTIVSLINTVRNTVSKLRKLGKYFIIIMYERHKTHGKMTLTESKEINDK